MARASEKGRGEGKSLQEIYFWILNFLVLGVWLGALGQGPQGEEEAGLENLFFNSKFPRFGWERSGEHRLSRRLQVWKNLVCNSKFPEI